LSAPDRGFEARAHGALPRSEGPTFPAPWAARAFALAVAANERGLFGWGEWSEALGAQVGAATGADAGESETYWRAWLAALEDVLARGGIASLPELATLQEAWRCAAEATPHGEPIELMADIRNARAYVGAGGSSSAQELRSEAIRERAGCPAP
jgi:nitrile hydratase accessory protein